MLVMAMIINVVNNMRTRSECRGRLIVLVMAMIINVVNNMNEHEVINVEVNVEANSASNGNDNQCCE